jgi:hypothetical protein
MKVDGRRREDEGLRCDATPEGNSRTAGYDCPIARYCRPKAARSLIVIRFLVSLRLIE